MVSEKKIFISHYLIMADDEDPLEGACMDPRVTVGMSYKADHYTLLQTKYESSGPCGFGEEDYFFHCKSTGGNDPLGGAILDITMLHTKYRSFGSCGLRD